MKTSEESVLFCGIYKNYETIIEIKRFWETQHPESFAYLCGESHCWIVTFTLAPTLIHIA